ncbi:MAG TPA: GDP-mannose 4,6-dehydratase [Vicinamibacterales bacterium]|nr:GDP-mannose 4,6-dehydratase [Vicinamibacterales bacterium]
MGPVLVTGAAGFAGSHLIDRLIAAGDADIVAWRRPGGRSAFARPGPRWRDVELADREQVIEAVRAARPAVVYHCAGAAQVAGSWADTATPLEINALGTYHLLEAVRREAPAARVVVVGSALVYRPSPEPLREEDPLGPRTPYGISKLAQEMIALHAAAADGLDVVVARPFNHIGPRQAPTFATASFARQIAAAEAGQGPRTIAVGNLDAVRDLTDVRDTVRAYELLAARGACGRPYNVCSGRGCRMQTVVDRLIAMARVPLELHVDPARVRPADEPVVVGDPGRIEQEIGWRAEIPLDRTLEDLLEYWREAVRREAR